MFLAKMPFGFILFLSPHLWAIPPVTTLPWALACLSIHLSNILRLSVCFHLCLYVCPSYSMSPLLRRIHISVCKPISPLFPCPFFHTPVHTFICPPVCLCMYLTAMMRERRSQQSIDLRETEKLVSQWNKPEPACLCLPCHAPEAARNAGNDLRHSRHVLAGISLAGWSAMFIVE